nr:MAG TPA: hypothetical protein [Caudoviricetes sp.]
MLAITSQSKYRIEESFIFFIQISRSVTGRGCYQNPVNLN